MSQPINIIKNLVAEDNISTALDELIFLLENTDEKRVDEAILLKGKYNRVKRDASVGALSNTDTSIQLQEISKGILSLLQNYQSADSRSQLSFFSIPKKKKMNISISISLIFILILIAFTYKIWTDIPTLNLGEDNKNNNVIVGDDSKIVNNITEPIPRDVEVREVKINEKSRINVKKGERVVLIADGSIKIGQWAGYSGPEGKTNGGMIGAPLDSYNIISTFPHAALLYRFKGDREWNLCGNGVEFTAERDGFLEFLVNDRETFNNHGSYQLKIEVYE